MTPSIALSSQAWDEQRRQEVKGIFEASGVVNISQQALNNPFETISKLSVESNEAGYWLTEVELLPGPNKIIAQAGGKTEERTVTFRITPPTLRVVLTWAGQNQDYDLHVKLSMAFVLVQRK